MPPKKLIIDTDPGIDDAMAILFAFASAEIELVGLTSIFGNVTTEIATRNALKLAELAGKPVPVAPGAERPLRIAPHPVADFIHGPEGFGDVVVTPPRGAAAPIPAARHLAEACRADPGGVTLCAIGPLTNLALALETDPALAENVGEVIVMGGSMREGGNVSAYAEANIWHDPHAAEKVFSAGWPLTMIGLDVTHRILCRRDEIARLAETSPRIGVFLKRASEFYLDFYEREAGLDGCHLHDPTAIIAAIRRGLFTFESVAVEVVTEGTRIGETRESEDRTRPPVNVARAVDADAVRGLFLRVLADS